MQLGKLLGVDYGDRRTGLAISDISGFLASGIGYIRESGMKNTAIRVAKEAKERGATGIVVGLPKNMDGTEGPRAEKARQFAELLREASGLEVTFWDERRTTIEAHSILHATGKKEKKHKGKVDAVAASLMLEGYLGSLRR